MPVPIIKIHQLPQGFTADADTDLQTRRADELVPVVGKLASLAAVKAATPLVGVQLHYQETLAVLNAGAHTFSLAAPNLYRGTNASWNQLLVSPDGGAYVAVTMPADGVGFITVAGATTVKATYATVHTTAKVFIAPNTNWVGGHIGLWPDVFVGLCDYPGDVYTDKITGERREPGLMPQFRDPGTYQINFRDGTVTFLENIDSVATPVRVNYAHLVGVTNYNQVTLEAVPSTGNTQFRIPAAHPAAGKQWVGRNDAFTPTNIYVGGVLTPQPQSVVPYETLTVKTA